ncbi:MAG: N-acetyltransferase family protein [Myxococcota bacterium]
MTLGPIRAARASDLADLVRIYNHYVRETPVTFDTEPFGVEARREWFAQFSDTGPHRLLVWEEDGAVRGYAHSGRHRPKPAYARSVETTIYLEPDFTGRGAGRRLYTALLDALRAEPAVHRSFAGVTLPNAASIALHTGLGFTPVGVFREIGWKFERYWDVAWYACDLEAPAD